jgi:hypothetical protein
MSAVRAGSPAAIWVRDRLCVPDEEVTIEATLYRSGLFGLFTEGVQGELLCFYDPQGIPLDNRLTDPSGSARTRLTAGTPGRYAVTVRLADNPRYSAEPATGLLFVAERERPLIFVMVESALQPPISTPWPVRDPGKIAAEPGSTEALSDVAGCHVLVYLTQTPEPSASRVRSWLEDRDYPPGPIAFLEPPPWIGILSEAPAPKTTVLEYLWRERSVPAYLLTRDRGFAEAAARNGVHVLLLAPEAPAGGRSPERKRQEDEHRQKGNGKGIEPIADWSAVPGICRCKAGKSGSRTGTRAPDRGFLITSTLGRRLEP